MANKCAMIEISTGFLYNFILWEGPVENWDTGSGYYLEFVTATSSYITGSDSPFSAGPPPEEPIPIEPNYTGSFTGSLTGSFNDYSGSLGWLDDFRSGFFKSGSNISFTGSISGSATGSFTGSYTGSLLGTVSNSSTASYVSNIKSGKVTSGEWVVELVGNNYTASVLLSSSYLNSSYAVSLTCGADVRMLSVTNKTPSGFNINSNSTSAMTDDVYWVTVPYNNP